MQRAAIFSIWALLAFAHALLLRFEKNGAGLVRGALGVEDVARVSDGRSGDDKKAEHRAAMEFARHQPDGNLNINFDLELTRRRLQYYPSFSFFFSSSWR